MDLGQEFARYFLEVEGRDSVVQTIHPDDEMFTYLQEIGRAPERCALEYFRTGREILLSLENLLGRVGRSFDDLGRVLDFACGFGRFTRFLVGVVPAERVWASDIVSDCVDFVGETFGVNAFASTTEPGSVDLPRGLDLITVISLFSHLPRATFEQWLAALYAPLSDDGLLVFSTHGADLCSKRMGRDGFTFIRQSESKNLETSEYGSTFVTPETVREIATSLGIPHLYTIEKEVSGFQDLHIVAKRPQPGLDAWRRTPQILGHIDALYVQGDHFQIDGWVAEIDGDTPLREVVLQVDGEDALTAKVGEPRPGVAEHYDRPEWTNSGWTVREGVPPMAPGRHVLTARTETHGGRRLVLDVRGLVRDETGKFTLI